MKIRRLLFPSLLVGPAMALIRRAFTSRGPAKPDSEDASHGPQEEPAAYPKEGVRGSYPEEGVRSTYDAIDAFVEKEMRRLKVPGVSLAIVEGDRIVHLRGFGRARPGGEVPAPHTPFPIGSLTKSFTALAVMQLIEAGRIELDAPVRRYLPWFRVADPQASARMTVRHLLHQTSGLPTWCGEVPLADFDDSPAAAERQARALSTLELTRPVGSAFEYSNMNYNLLGLIIAAASGEPYAHYIQDHIFTPLGMSHSYTSRSEARQNGLAVGHRYWFMVPIAAPNIPLPRGSLPTGMLICSAEDMARYLIAHLNGGRYGDVQILSSAGIEELHKGVAHFSVMGRSLGYYGMGWFVDKIGQTKLVSHGGTLPDFAAHIALLPEQKKGMVLLLNADNHWMMPALEEFGTGVAALLAGEEPPPAPIPFVGMFPWALRVQLLIPALQIAGVVATLRLLRRWRHDPERRPSGRRALERHALLPLIASLLPALLLKPVLGKRRGYLLLYTPDFSWIATVCGSFALLWSILRTGLVLQALHKPSS